MTKKRPYSPPSVFRVELNQEQAILTACSLMTASLLSGGMMSCRGMMPFACKRTFFLAGDSGARPS